MNYGVVKLLKSIKEMFKEDDFIASSAVFPEIDKEKIASDLKLEMEGEKRGKVNQPASTSSGHDHIELKAIGCVDERRRRGLENYETNRQVYMARLKLAVSARMEVEMGADYAKAQFVQEVTKQKARIVTPRDRVFACCAWYHWFRRVNKLKSPATLDPVWPMIIALSFVMILLESAGNAYLFSQSNPLGILGGLIAAFLVSAGNVGVSMLLGMLSRYINCHGLRNLHKKLFGLLLVVLWLGFMGIYNLAVAHFRDVAERIAEWRQAGTVAIETLIANPTGLNAMESYLLLLLGAFISVVSFIKGHNAGDSHPGYAKTYQDWIDARTDYEHLVENSTNELARHYNEGVAALQNANREVHVNINDSIDALYGHKALTANLGPFLGQCDIAANYVLAVYRDANKAARDNEPPDYFGENFSFKPFVLPETDKDRRAEAEEQLKEVSEMVNLATREIFDAFNRAVGEIPTIDEIESKAREVADSW